MPWPPGLVPVAKVDQATGVWAGCVVATRAKPPRSRSRARLGSPPAANRRSTADGSSPSSPTVTTFLKRFIRWPCRRSVQALGARRGSASAGGARGALPGVLGRGGGRGFRGRRGGLFEECPVGLDERPRQVMAEGEEEAPGSREDRHGRQDGFRPDVGQQ